MVGKVIINNKIENKSNIFKTFFRNKTYYIKYPCDKYPNSITIDHFHFGCSWCCIDNCDERNEELLCQGVAVF